MLDLVRIGEKLKELRVSKNISQSELAEMLYCTRQAISRWEQGQGLPTIDNMCELIKIYDVSLDELLCLNEEIVIDKENIFLNHNRAFIIKEILCGNIKVNLADVFYQFSKIERITMINAIKDGEFQTNLEELVVKLTDAEKRILFDKPINELHKKEIKK